MWPSAYFLGSEFVFHADFQRALSRPSSVISVFFLASIFDVCLAYRGGGGIGYLEGILGPYTVSSWLSVYI